MSSDLSALLSATFYEAGDEHRVELIHQRDRAARRRLASLDLAVYDPEGKNLTAVPLDTHQEILDLGTLVGPVAAGRPRVMVLLDARYEEQIFPYPPHHYGFLHRRGSTTAALYYALNAVLGGVPDRIGATGLNNFETYIFLREAFAERYSVLLGNPARFSTAEAQVTAYYATGRLTQVVALAPKAHREVALTSEHAGERLQRVEIKALFRLASYVVGRRADSGELVLFDHLFSYHR